MTAGTRRVSLERHGEFGFRGAAGQPQGGPDFGGGGMDL